MRKERWLVIVFAIRFNDVELFRQWRKRGFTSSCGDNGGQFRQIDRARVRDRERDSACTGGGGYTGSLLKVIVKVQGNLLLLLTRLQNDTRQNDWY